MIDAVGLCKQFDGFVAVDGVTFSVAPGEVLALLGHNGAGKTTTVRMLAGVIRPTAGQARVAGFDVAEHPQAVRRHVGLLTEHPGLYLRMTGREYLRFFGRLMGMTSNECDRRAGDLLERLGMLEAWDRRTGTYSKGMRQKMALVRAMLHDPMVLLLDEPTSALDPTAARLVRDAIARLRDHRRAVVLCTHNLVEAETLADRVAIIRRGRIVALGTPAELKARWLGHPVMELRLAHPLNGTARFIAEWGTVEAQGENWIRYSTPDPQETNPLLVRLLALQGVEIVTIREVPRSLEEVYLQVTVGGVENVERTDPVP